MTIYPRFVLFILCILFTQIEIIAQPGKHNFENWNTKQASRFTENKGQVTDQNGNLRSDVKYIYSAPGFKAIFKANSFSYEVLTVEKKPNKISESTGKHIDNLISDKFKQLEDISVKSHRVDIDLPGANPNTQIIVEGKSIDYNNYYLAHTPEQGVHNVHSYTKLTYKNIWPKIDIIFYVRQEGELKYDIVVHPGGDLKNVALNYNNAGIFKLENNTLNLQTTLGHVFENIPLSYTLQDKHIVKISYSKYGNTIRYKGNYDKNKTLVIDPAIKWSTYFGGSNFEEVYGIAADDSAYINITGNTKSSSSIATTGAYKTTYAGDYDAYVVQFDEEGNMRWATYYGGNEEDKAFGIVADKDGNLYITGYTLSTTAMSSTGAHQEFYGGGFADAFLAKFNKNGKRIWSTYYGGSGGDGAYGLACDKAGNVCITGSTLSLKSISTSGAHQQTLNYFTTPPTLHDGFVAKFDSAGLRQWATYYGGTQDDEGRTVAIDDSGSVFMAGRTESTGLATFGAFQTTLNTTYSRNDAFLVKFSSSGKRLWATYFGGNYWESAHKITTDASGNCYMTGTTYSIASIATAKAYKSIKTYYTSPDAFLVKFSSSGKRIWATYYGGTGDEHDSGGDIVTDSLQNVYLCGSTQSTSLIATGSGWQTIHAGVADGFIVKFDSSGSRMWATYFGYDADDGFGKITLGKKGRIYLAGNTMSSYKIATSNAYQTSYAGNLDAFIIRVDGVNNDIGLVKINNNLNTICAADSFKLSLTLKNNHTLPTDSIIEVGYLISGPEDIVFQDTMRKSISSLSNDTFVFTNFVLLKNAGRYKLKVYLITPDSDNRNDTLFTEISVFSRADVDFTANAACLTLGIEFTNNTTVAGGSVLAYKWSFGDGSYSTLKDPQHIYAVADKYKVTLLATTDKGCTDSFTNWITVFAKPTAAFHANNVCLANEVAFTNTSLQATQYHWNFGDGDSSDLENPTHTYAALGQYKVFLTVTSHFGCIDSISKTITVYPLPKANFSTKNICLKDSALFTDASISAQQYIWNFGDGNISLQQKPSHKYTKAGIYTVTQKVRNMYGCWDSISKEIEVYDRAEAIFSAGDICVTDSFTFHSKGKGATQWLWKFGDDSYSFDENPKYKYSSAGKYDVWLIVSNNNGCKDSVMHTITVDSTCVWPGDANADKVVDNKDILAIGIAYADTGSARTDTSTIWKAHLVKNWTNSFASGANYKHADSDGNGTISYSDTMAVTRNYTKTHAKKQLTNRGKSGDPVLKIDIQNDSLKAGDTLVAYILLGENALPANDVYGLAFSLDFNTDYFTQPKVDFSGSWFGSNAITYSNTTNGLDIALSRTDQKNISGAGKIAAISMVVLKDVTYNQQVKLEITDNLLISASEKTLPTYPVNDSVMIYKKPNSILNTKKTDSPTLVVYPNPFKHQTTIEFDLLKAGKVIINLYDVNGRSQNIMASTMLSSGKHKFTLDAEKFKINSGVYIISVESEGLQSHQRIIKLK